MLAGPQSLSEGCGTEKNLPLSGIEPWVVVIFGSGHNLIIKLEFVSIVSGE
jgi:hypothetical protein